MADARDAAPEAAASPSASQPRLSQQERTIAAPGQSSRTHEGSLPLPAQLPGAFKAKAADGARDESASADGSCKPEQEQRELHSTPEAETAALQGSSQAGAAGEADASSSETAQVTSQATAPAGSSGDAPTPQHSALRSETRPVSKVSDGGQQPAAPAPDAMQDAEGSSSSGVQPPSSPGVITRAGDAQASAARTAQAVGSPIAMTAERQTPAEPAGVEAEHDSGVSAEGGATGTSRGTAESAAPSRSQEGAEGAAVVKRLAATDEASPQLSQAQELQLRLPSEQGQHPIAPVTASQQTGVPEAAQEPDRSAEAAGPPDGQPSSADCASTPFAAAAQAAQPLPGCCGSQTDSTPHSMDIACIGQCKLVSWQCCLWCEDSLALSVQISCYVYMLKKLELLLGC